MKLQDQQKLAKLETSADKYFLLTYDELEKGNPVKIPGFGKWTVKSKRERKGRNPQTGDRMTIDARKVVTFKLSVVLRDELNY